MPILELLQDVEGIDPNLVDNDGNTPLIFAAQAGRSSLIYRCVSSIEPESESIGIVWLQY